MSFLETLQQAWQSQRCATPTTNPDELLKSVRVERRVAFWIEMSVILFFACVGIGTFWRVFRDLREDWPWLIYTAAGVWVVGYMLFNQWRRRRHAARYDEPLLAHVEWSIKDIEHMMWQDRYSPWWYVMPIALGCVLPPILLFAVDSHRQHDWGDIFKLLSTLGFFAVVFIVVYLAMKYGRRISDKRRLQELHALRTLREGLLNTEEPHE